MLTEPRSPSLSRRTGRGQIQHHKSRLYFLIGHCNVPAFKKMSFSMFFFFLFSTFFQVVLKLQQLRVSHRQYTCYPQHPYPSIFRLNFHHYYPISYDTYPCDSGSYLRRSADLKAKRRRGRPAKASEPITSKLPFVQGYGYPLGGGNYYAAPYAMPYAPPLNLGYFPHTPPFYLPHHALGPAPPSPFMRPAVPPPPKAFHSSGHSKLQGGTKMRSTSGPLQGPTVRGEGLGSLSNGGAGGLAGVRLHKRKHKHKHKHKDEPLLSPRDRQELGGLFSGAKTSARLSMLSERRDLGSQGSLRHLEKQKGNARSSNLGSSLGIFESDQLSTHSLTDSQFHSRQAAQPLKSFMSSYSSQSQRSESASDLFSGLQDECVERSRRARLTVFGDQGLMSFQTSRQEPEQLQTGSSTSLTGKSLSRVFIYFQQALFQNSETVYCFYLVFLLCGTSYHLTSCWYFAINPTRFK